MSSRTIPSLFAAAVLGTVALASAAAPPESSPASQDPVARGRYLVKIMGCNDCHTPWKMGPQGPEPDMSRELSGHPQDVTLPPAPAAQGPWVWSAAATNTAFAGPWGVSFTANLTPDPETGLGHWTPETFVSAIRSGRHEGQGRPLLPPMPWPMYRNATDADLRAVFVYLQTLPKIRNRVPQPIDPPEAN
ncbi:MAG: diheme cytochrome c-553 [Vicinamibacteria bacterium]|nr:diheme cytochrome c-553 [Vicinamibacteria bacterium]